MQVSLSACGTSNAHAQRLLSPLGTIPSPTGAIHSSSSPFSLHQRNQTFTFSSLSSSSNTHSLRRCGPIASAGVGDRNSSSSEESPAKALRRLLESPGVHQGPACYDGLSAKLVQKAGFHFCFTSGFSISAARLGLPDAGLISYGEMVDQGQKITDAVSIPIIGDGDNGYGNAMNVKRTVKGYIKSGFAGIILEDQVSPKACGHTQGRKVVALEEAVMRIKAAVDARKESGSDIVIVARTDSRQAVSLEESLRRSRAFADAGADVLFIDALTSTDEMKAFCGIAPSIPKMANMLEGGGKTPILTPMELEDLGYKIVAYPLSLIGVSIKAMQDALSAIRTGRVPPPGNMPSFEEIKDILGFNEYYEEEKRYALGMTQPTQQRGVVTDVDVADDEEWREIVKENSWEGDDEAEDVASDNSLVRMDQGNMNDEQSQQGPRTEVIIPEIYNDSGTSRSGLGGMWSRTLRVRITGRDGVEKLDVRIPAGFLDGITNTVPALVGVNLKELLDNAADGMKGKLLDFNDPPGDRIEVFLE